MECCTGESILMSPKIEVCRGAHRLYVLAFPSPFPSWDMHCCLWLFQHLPRCCTKIRGPLSPISGSPILLAHKTGYVYGIAPSQAPQECTRQLKDASQGSRHTLACAACIHVLAVYKPIAGCISRLCSTAASAVSIHISGSCCCPCSSKLASLSCST